MLVVDAGWRFERVDELVPEGVFVDGHDWDHSPGGVTALDTDPPGLRLTARGFDEIAYIAKIIARPRAYRYLRVSADVRTQALKGMTEPWHGGRLLMMSFDKEGRRLWYWPTIVAAVDGTNAWRRYSAVIPVNDDSDEMKLVAYAAAQSGSLQLRGLRVDSMKERMLFTVLRFAVIGSWAVVGLWLVFLLASRRLRSPVRLVAISLAVTITVAGLVPQPYLNHALKTLLFGAQDVVFAGSNFVRRVGAGIDQGAATSPADVGPETIDRKVSVDTAYDPDASADTYRPPEGGAESDEHEPRYWTPSWEDLDKKEHLVAFLLLGLLASFAYRQYPSVRVVASLIALASSIQVMQSLSNTRESDIGDWQYDVLGIAVGVSMVYLLTLLRRLLPIAKASGG